LKEQAFRIGGQYKNKYHCKREVETPKKKNYFRARKRNTAEAYCLVPSIVQAITPST
jgi:hypothetical protein